MRARLAAIGLLLSLSLICAADKKLSAQDTTTAARPELRIPPAIEAGAKLPSIVSRYDAYFARRGSGRGSGYRQYSRALEFTAPRLYPSGDLVNTTALTWFNHFRAVRAPEFLAARQAAVTAGIGTGNWRLMGPLQSLEQADAGDAGRVNVVAFDPADAMTIYMGTPLGGLWRTQDGGATWTSLTDGLPMIAVTDIAVDPQERSTLYVLTGDGEGGEANHGPPSIGVLKSVDGGEHWTTTALVWNSAQRHYGHRMAIHPRVPAILLVAATAGLLRSTDGGGTWQTALSAGVQNPFWDVLFHPLDASVVYAATTTDVYRSLDAGETWTRLEGGLPSFTDRSDPNFSNRIRLAVTSASPDTLYVLYGSRFGFTNGLYRSDDRGNTFEKRSSTMPVSKDPNAPRPVDLTKPNILGYNPNDFESQSNYTLALTVSPTDADRVHVGAVDTWRSDDGGRTWKQTSRWFGPGEAKYMHADMHFLAYRDGAIYSANDGGLYRSDDAGETWTSITNVTSAFSIALVYHVCGTPHDENLFYYGAQDNGTYRLLLNGATKRMWTGDGMACQIDPRDTNIVYSSYVRGELLRSDKALEEPDGGVAIRPRVGDEPVPGPWLTPYVLGPQDPDSVYACYADVWLSPDRGSTWKNLSNGALGASKQCVQVAVAPSDPRVIYVAKDAEWDAMHMIGHGDPRTPFLGGGGVFRSSDGGRTWQLISSELPLAKAGLTNLAVSPTDARKAWVTFSGYSSGVKVFATDDGGMSWKNVSSGLPNLPTNAIAAKRGETNGIYVGMDSGIYYHDDRLDGWVPFADGLPNVVVISLLIDELRGRLIAGTFGRGVWMTDIASPCTANCADAPGSRLARARPNPPALRGSYIGAVEAFE
jgi:photosystem II stability/assembly factor-like uncharacterized protein